MKGVRWLFPGAAVMALISCSSKEHFRYEDGIAWNTFYHITYEAEADLSDSIRYIFDAIDSSLSPFNPQSTVTKINDNLSDSIDYHFKVVYNESSRINRETDGAFDPTLAPLIRVWGFGQGHELSADTLRIDSLLKYVGIARTRLEGQLLIKEDPRIEFNFSALAKGYGVDCIADMLGRNGSDNYLVEVGGEIRSAGHNPKGTDWTIGIDRPDAEAKAGEMSAVISISDAALATSGNYRNFHESGGERFGHTISAVTGRPVKTDVISATVITQRCMEADALATCCMALGSDEALNLCTRLRAGVMLIRDDMSVVTNSIWQASEPESTDRD